MSLRVELSERLTAVLTQANATNGERLWALGHVVMKQVEGLADSTDTQGLRRGYRMLKEAVTSIEEEVWGRAFSKRFECGPVDTFSYARAIPVRNGDNTGLGAGGEKPPKRTIDPAAMKTSEV